MAKTIDKLTAYGVSLTDGMKKQGAEDYLTGNLFNAVPVVADSVLPQYWGNNTDIHKFAPLIPPFEYTWVEGSIFNVPWSSYLSMQKASDDRYSEENLRKVYLRATRDKYRIGILYTAQKVEDGNFYGLHFDYEKHQIELPHGWTKGEHDAVFATGTTASYWCSALLFLDLGKRVKKILGPMNYTGFPLDERGYFMPEESTRIVENTFYKKGGNAIGFSVGGMAEGVPFYGIGPKGMQSNPWVTTSQKAKILNLDLITRSVTSKDDRENQESMFVGISGLLYSVGLMNCNNIDTVVVEPSRGHSKKFKKQSGKPLLRYRLITVEHNNTGKIVTIKGEKHRDDNTVEENDIPKHIVRGHFKTYTKERPLFGKTHGTWWWPEQERGDKEHGEIVHEYEVVS